MTEATAAAVPAEIVPTTRAGEGRPGGLLTLQLTQTVQEFHAPEVLSAVASYESVSNHTRKRGQEARERGNEANEKIEPILTKDAVAHYKSKVLKLREAYKTLGVEITVKVSADNLYFSPTPDEEERGKKFYSANLIISLHKGKKAKEVTTLESPRVSSEFHTQLKYPDSVKKLNAIVDSQHELARELEADFRSRDKQVNCGAIEKHAVVVSNKRMRDLELLQTEEGRTLLAQLKEDDAIVAQAALMEMEKLDKHIAGRITQQ